MRRIFFGAVPDSYLDSEAKITAWAKKKASTKGLVPLEVTLCVSKTHADRTHKSLKIVTTAEILCDDAGELQFIGYHEGTPFDVDEEGEDG